jgi:hypothetical protein
MADGKGAWRGSGEEVCAGAIAGAADGMGGGWRHGCGRSASARCCTGGRGCLPASPAEGSAGEYASDAGCNVGGDTVTPGLPRRARLDALGVVRREKWASSIPSPALTTRSVSSSASTAAATRSATVHSRRHSPSQLIDTYRRWLRSVSLSPRLCKLLMATRSLERMRLDLPMVQLLAARKIRTAKVRHLAARPKPYRSQLREGLASFSAVLRDEWHRHPAESTNLPMLVVHLRGRVLSPAEP